MKTIALCSFKGGTAKTSTSIHLGAAFALYQKKKVLLIDFDSQGNLTTGLGLDPDELDSLAPVLQEKKPLRSIIKKSSIEGLDIIPGDSWLERVELSEQLAQDRYSHEKLRELLKRQRYDLCIIDTPPSLCWLTESALIAANYALICATPEFYSIKGLQRLAGFIESISKRHPLKVLGVSLAFWNERGKCNESFLKIIESTFPNKTLKNRLRRDISISEASIHGKSVFQTAPKSRAALDYLALSKEIFKQIK